MLGGDWYHYFMASVLFVLLLFILSIGDEVSEYEKLQNERLKACEKTCFPAQVIDHAGEGAYCVCVGQSLNDEPVLRRQNK